MKQTVRTAHSVEHIVCNICSFYGNRMFNLYQFKLLAFRILFLWLWSTNASFYAPNHVHLKSLLWIANILWPEKKFNVNSKWYVVCVKLAWQIRAMDLAITLEKIVHCYYRRCITTIWQLRLCTQRCVSYVSNDWLWLFGEYNKRRRRRRWRWQCGDRKPYSNTNMKLWIFWRTWVLMSSNDDNKCYKWLPWNW